MLLEGGIYSRKPVRHCHDFRFCKHRWHFVIMAIKGDGGPVVESGCKRIYNDRNQNFLDLIPVNYDICSFVRVVVSSTNLYIWASCDIL